ncbi:hypothetical protein TanjilG_30841 [Lupinus angustifolius]|uniref:SAM domain-containing protein n=1 Tax=Lupinus angustifolius TaxID=3871 RepID=A0A394DH28_LUPAN|nr:PREDICTED: uncharacterized protein LOC109337546 [Lupinus angustifolius]OIW19927.1 hypothetical protein TanjilG_30841 [Lupinus angustifolius]
MADTPAAVAAAEEGNMNVGGTLPLNPSEFIGSKRQRRPSVRLGDIGGDNPYDSHPRRSTKPWKVGFDNHRRDSNNVSGKPSKTRPLTNLSSAEFGGENLDGQDDRDATANADSVVIGNWKVKDSKKRGSSGAPTKRARTNWVSRINEGGGGGGDGDGEDNYFSGSGGGGEEKFFSSGDYGDGDGYRDFDVENSERLKEQRPINSLENLGVDGNDRELNYQGNRSSIRVRVSDDRENHDGIELSGPSDNDVRDRNGNSGGGRRGRYREDGVRIWLNGLGLGRYAPVFEIHEVDDEVLPLLTIEDLKDMGINAVGSRRKMYCAIQKLGTGFS